MGLIFMATQRPQVTNADIPFCSGLLKGMSNAGDGLEIKWTRHVLSQIILEPSLKIQKKSGLLTGAALRIFLSVALLRGGNLDVETGEELAVARQSLG